MGAVCADGGMGGCGTSKTLSTVKSVRADTLEGAVGGFCSGFIETTRPLAQFAPKLFQTVGNELMHCATVAKTNFGFRGMHIDIDTARRYIEEQHIRRVTLMVQHIGVGGADGVADHLVAHITLVRAYFACRRAPAPHRREKSLPV